MPEVDAILAEHKTLGPYTLTKKLGEGGMGGVYLGRHNVLQVDHAIKIIRPRMASDPQLVERFMREARHAARLIHPNIVQVLAADVADGLYYLAMQFVPGQSLADAIAKAKLPPHRAVRYIHMACLGLSYAHRKQIIHRDIKPGNLLIDDEDNVKITDFGLVRDMAADDTGQNNLTQTGLIIGTPHFMPPEQWHGEGVDHRSDIYAMGVTLFHLITRTYPYPGRTPPQILGLLMQGKPEPIKKYAPSVDDELERIILKAMATDMEQRYQSAADFANDLEKWFQSHPPSEADVAALNVEGRDAAVGTKMATPTQLKASGTLGGNSSRAGVATQTGRPTSGISASSQATVGEPGPMMTTPAPMMPTPMPTQPQVTIIQQGNKTGVMVGLVLVALVALALGAYAVFGGNKGAGNATDGSAGGDGKTPTPYFTLKLSSSEATEASPQYTANASYAIEGDASGPVTLNGKPYKFGEAITLNEGKNSLHVAAEVGTEKVSRTIVVVLDTTSPEIAIRQLDLPLTTAAKFVTITGNVKEASPGVKVAAYSDSQQLAPITVDKDGNFEFTVKLGDEEVKVDVIAEDRVGNKKTKSGQIIPDRGKLVVDWDSKPGKNGFKFGSENVKLSAKVNKQGCKVRFEGKDVAVEPDGGFAISKKLAEGKHALKVEVTDAVGATASLEADVTVDLTAPKLTLANKELLISVREFPAEPLITGTVDDFDADLTVDGQKVELAEGKFSAKLTYTKAGKFAVKVAASDFAQRKAEETVEVTVKLQLYVEKGKNEQGHMEYERLRDGMIMVLIPAGEFIQGIKSGLPDAGERRVKMSAYLIGKHEVTNAQYAKFLNATAKTRDDAGALIGKDEQGGLYNLEFTGKLWKSKDGQEQKPVVGVTWRGAREYCTWADETGGELPSEAQWEYAARGKDGRTYPWGEKIGLGVANYKGGGLEVLADVGTFKEGASPFGVLDAAGNVEEWCFDWYDVTAYTQKGDDPVLRSKPPGGDRRVVRGGSFLSNPTSETTPTSEDARSDLRTFQRGRRLPDTSAPDRGFRACAKVPQ